MFGKLEEGNEKRKTKESEEISTRRAKLFKD